MGPAERRLDPEPPPGNFKPHVKPRFTEAQVPIGSIDKSVFEMEKELDGRGGARGGMSVLVAEIEDNEILEAALVEEIGNGSCRVLPLDASQLRTIIASPTFEPTMKIASEVGQPFFVEPGDDVVYVMDSIHDVVLGDLPIFNPPLERDIYRREDMQSDIDERVQVIGQSEDGTRVVGRNGAAFVSVAREAFDEDPKYNEFVTLSRDEKGRERAAPDVQLELGR